MANGNSLGPEQIVRRLSDYRELALDDPYPEGFFPAPARPAAVLLPLFQTNDGWRLLFIRRAENAGDRHSGQVAFPGGHLEPMDPSPTAAALREAQEEIGLTPKRVRVLGQLPAYHTATNFLVTPVVGEIAWPQALRIDPREVTRVFSIPLGWLAAANHRRVEQRRFPGLPTELPVVYYEPYRGEQLWGASARISQSLLRVLGIDNAA